MELKFVTRETRALDHERIWGAIGAALIPIGLVFPLDRVTTRCPFKAITGIPCPTCGMTRSFLHLRQFEFWQAFLANPLIFAVAVFAAAYCLYAWTAVLFRTRRIHIAVTQRWEPTVIRIAVAVVFFANWIYLIAMGR